MPEILEMMHANGKIVVLMLDQSQIRVGLECLMVSVGVGDRALPMA